ncbi:MAG: hypothetical protein CM1200mP18_12500 [Gammaproteobacteria bacterium]|nr:MAG: hypothetical protein CM1200mP18_12500 [Gammaproteobacteria bacterium]
MDAGLGKFGDFGFMEEVSKRLGRALKRKTVGAGNGRVGAHYQLEESP